MGWFPGWRFEPGWHGRIRERNRQVHELGGFVLGCVHAIQARNANQGTTPSANDQTAARVLHRNRETAKEIGTAYPHSFETNQIVDSGDVVSPVESREWGTGLQNNHPTLATGTAVTGKIRLLPPFQTFAVEQRNPVGALLRSRRFVSRSLENVFDVRSLRDRAG